MSAAYAARAVDFMCSHPNCPDKRKCGRHDGSGKVIRQPFQKYADFPLKTDTHGCSGFINVRKELPSMAAEKESSAAQKVYGRGLFDGLRKAGIEDPKEFMNNARLKDIEASLSGIASKVYEVMPPGEAIKIHEIVKRIAALGSAPDYKVVQGCVANLIDKNLVREPSAGAFVRVPPKPALVARAADDSAPKSVETIAAKSEPGTMDSLVEIAAGLRARGSELLRFADQIDAEAIAVEENLQKARFENSKLAQLKELLKSI